ncbi:MAG: (Fe-S)-binding protein [Planctomycetes bacterium]|nr:(Fe-S)-binding protein [Planctomycetota bacterium]
MPHVGLFIPCYVDQLYPDVGMATLELLERYGCTVDFPEAQTCCGQPMANTGCTDQAKPLAEKFVTIFQNYEYIVCPSGSCTAMVTHHYEELLHHNTAYESVRRKTFELCEFMTDILKIQKVEGRFPYKVGLHNSCHGLRELRLGSSSETMGPQFNKAAQLLSGLEDIELVPLKRADECCGFGGTFAIAEEAVSCMMGLDRIHDHEQAGAEVMTAGDMSCLMHLSGLIARQKKPLSVMHVAQILAGRQPIIGGRSASTGSRDAKMSAEANHR